jgi:hypothetical protein
LLLDQFEHLRRDERAKRSGYVIRDVPQGKEAGKCEQEKKRRKQRQEEVVRQLRRKPGDIIIERFTPRTAT